ncbi:MAG: cytochrome c [Acidobacteriota bacterium]|nr:cytochrome c [Acidobacteriota bacterium]
MKFLKGLAILVVALLILGVIGVGTVIGWPVFFGPKSRALTDRKFDSTPERLKRGAYLAEHVAACMDCHTPFETGASGPEATAPKLGSGQIFPDEGLPGLLVAPNLTPDPETGIGSWSDDQLARAIREGVGHDGRALFPLMPYLHYRQMSDEDLASLVVYLRALPPVRHPLPSTNIRFPVKYFMRTLPQPVGQVAQPDVSTPVNRGKYLVNIAACADCHTRPNHGKPAPGLEFAGGRNFTGPWGVVTSANITPDPTGIANYTDDTFLKALRTGYVGTRQLNTLMPWQNYAGQTEEDLKAIFAYLKTLSPVTHRVDNSKPGTACRKCGMVHGGGDAN